MWTLSVLAPADGAATPTTPRRAVRRHRPAARWLAGILVHRLFGRCWWLTFQPRRLLALLHQPFARERLAAHRLLVVADGARWLARRAAAKHSEAAGRDAARRQDEGGGARGATEPHALAGRFRRECHESAWCVQRLARRWRAGAAAAAAATTLRRRSNPDGAAARFARPLRLPWLGGSGRRGLTAAGRWLGPRYCRPIANGRSAVAAGLSS